MRALVTGGHGFVGSHLVDRLLADGVQVRALYRRPGAPEAFVGKPVELARGDLRDAASLQVAVADVDVVYHLAGLTRSLARHEMFEINVEGTRLLLEALAGSGFTGRFVFCSSLSVAGPSTDAAPADESRAPAPVTWYGESKALAERVVAGFADRYDVTCLRPPPVYGPGDRDFLGLFQAVGRGVVPVVGSLDRACSMIYVRDLAAALVVGASDKRVMGGTYYVSHPEVITQEALIQAAERAVGRRARRLELPASLVRLAGRAADLGGQLTGRASLFGSQRVRELVAGHWVCSPAAFERETGWRASVGVDEGFAETVASNRDAGRLPPGRDGAIVD